jgi:uncharacterized protein YjbI with pentapeptide repeats
MATIQLRTVPDSASGHRRILLTIQASAAGFDLQDFLRLAADGTMQKLGIRSLANADLDDLRSQAVANGFQSALTQDGRLKILDVDLRDANLSGMRATQADMTGAKLARAILDGAIMDGCRLPGASLDGASMREASFRNADMRGTTMTAAKREGPGRPRRVGTQEEVVQERLNVRGTSAHFEGALLDGAEIANANLSNAHFRGTSLRNANITSSSFDEADLAGADFGESKLFNNSLRTATAGFCRCTGASLWANNYLPKAAWTDFLSLRPDRKMDAICSREEIGWWKMDTPMRVDYLRSLAFKIATLSAAGWLTARTMESAGLLAALGAMGTSLGTYVTLHQITHEVAHKAVDAAIEWTGAAKFYATGLAKELAGKVGLISNGPAIGAVDEMIGRSATFDIGGGLSVAVANMRDLDDILTRSSALDSPFVKVVGSSRLIRKIGSGYPEETAPSEVAVGADGVVKALWVDQMGKPLKGVAYRADGTPLGVFDVPTKKWHPMATETDPFFTRPRAPMAELRDCIIRACVPHDAMTHVATLRKDGTIIVRSVSSGRVDNALGKAAIRRPSGGLTGFVNGISTGPVAEAAHANGRGLALAP